MASAIQLIVGLGNPGKDYAETRHNAGAWFVADLANEAHTLLRPAIRYHGLYVATEIHKQPCHLLIPTTFMNHSGQAVQACLNYFKLVPDSVLIVHDEIDLPVGTIRLKFDGGDGGHNGLKDIISHLHTKKFYRLRIGVGRPENSLDVADYVLHAPSKVDRQKIDSAVQQGFAVLPDILQGDFQKAMRVLHNIP